MAGVRVPSRKQIICRQAGYVIINNRTPPEGEFIVKCTLFKRRDKPTSFYSPDSRFKLPRSPYFMLHCRVAKDTNVAKPLAPATKHSAISDWPANNRQGTN